MCKILVGREIFAGEHVFFVNWFAEGAVGERATESVSKVFICGIFNAIHDAADAFGGDGVCIIFALNKDKLSVPAIFFVECEDGVGGGTTASERVKNNVVLFGSKTNQILQQLNWFRIVKNFSVAKYLFQYSGSITTAIFRRSLLASI